MSSAKWYSDSDASTATTTATAMDKRYVQFVFNDKDISAL